MAYFSKLTASGQVVTGRYKFHGYLIGTDGTNDPTITITDEDNAAGKNSGEMIPTATYDATALGMNGAILTEPIDCLYGIYLTISISAGAVEVTVFYS